MGRFCDQEVMRACYSSSDEDEARGFQTHTIDKGRNYMDDHPQAICTFPANASLFTSAKGYKVVMVAYDAEVARAPVPYQSQLVSTRYGATHILSGGPRDAPPVFLFHHWRANAAGIGASFPFLFASYRVYMPDIIGQMGKSAPTRPPTDGPAYAAWVADLFDALGISQAMLIGISGGGWVVLKCAAYAPERVKKAVVVSTVGLSGSFSRWAQFVRAPLFGVVIGLFPFRPAIGWAARSFTSPHASGSSWYASFVEGIYLGRKYFKGTMPPGPLTDDELRRITSPTLVLVGQYEHLYHPSAAVERARRLIPGLVGADMLADAGHTLMQEQPEMAAARILAFLSTPHAESA
jgi:pimeloyl-ACP methyl ester carboxylesterase